MSDGPTPRPAGSAAANGGTGRSIVVSLVTVLICGPDGRSPLCTRVPVNGSVRMKAVAEGGGRGTYQWSTTSPKIMLGNANTDTVTVTARNQVSTAVGAEELRLVYTPEAAAPLSPMILNLTVFSVSISRLASQNYGYDDMDNAAGVEHHVSVKKNGTTTVHVLLRGGVTGADLLIVSDDPSIAEPMPPAGGGAAFDLAISGKNRAKDKTHIRVRCNCPERPVCATIEANVYNERAVSATVAKIHDSHVPATALTRPNFDVTAAADLINTAYKAAVINLTLTDQSPTGGAIDVRYDLDGDGKLTLEAGATGGEIAAIKAAFNPPGQKIVIVKDLSYIFYLSVGAAVGDRSITLKSSYGGNINFLTVGTSYAVGSGANREMVTIQSKAANVLTLSAPLTRPHATTEGILFPVGGLGGNPIILPESTATTEDLQRWVIGHECGHAIMTWEDLNAADNLMNFSMGWTDHRLRFKPQPRYYNPPGGNESQGQWEKVSR